MRTVVTAAEAPSTVRPVSSRLGPLELLYAAVVVQTVLMNPVVANVGSVNVYLNSLSWPVAAFCGFLRWASARRTDADQQLGYAVSRLALAMALVGMVITAGIGAGGLHDNTVANLLRLAYVPIGIVAGLAVARSIDTLLDVVVVALGAKGLLALWGLAHGPIDVLHRITVSELGGHNIFGAFVSFVILARAATWILADRRPGPVVTGALAVGAACVFLTFSRGAVAALLVGSAVLAFQALRSGRWARKPARALVVLAMLAVPLVPNTPIHARFTTLSIEQSSGRDALWRPAWDGFFHRPVDGNGFGSFEAESTSFGDVVHAEAIPVTYSTHNLPLQILYETGLVGLLAVLVAVALVVGRCWHPVIAASLAAMVAHTMFETYPYVVQTSWVYGLVLALGMAYRLRATASRR